MCSIVRHNKNTWLKNVKGLNVLLHSILRPLLLRMASKIRKIFYTKLIFIYFTTICRADEDEFHPTAEVWSLSTDKVGLGMVSNMVSNMAIFL